MSQLGNTLGNRPLIHQLPKRSSHCAQQNIKNRLVPLILVEFTHTS
jgi:hypothetical protein